MLVDHHCHLEFPQLAQQREGVIARAQAAGVGVLLTICTRISRLDEIIAICEGYPNIFCSVGTHPHNADEEQSITVSELVRLAQHERVVAIGEAGLDYYYKNSTPLAQVEGFRRHIRAARESGLPLEIHTRDADADTIRILREEYSYGPFCAVLHCFTGGRELAMAAVDLGLYVSFSGVVTFKNADALRTTARDIPGDRLLVETDAPFLSPEPNRGRINEPSNLVHTAAMLGKIRGVTADAIAQQTTANFFRLFSKVPRSLLPDGISL